MLYSAAKVCPETYTGSSVIITGVGGSGFPVPLHRIWLESELVHELCSIPGSMTCIMLISNNQSQEYSWKMR